MFSSGTRIRVRVLMHPPPCSRAQSAEQNSLILFEIIKNCDLQSWVLFLFCGYCLHSDCNFFFVFALNKSKLGNRNEMHCHKLLSHWETCRVLACMHGETLQGVWMIRCTLFPSCIAHEFWIWASNSHLMCINHPGCHTFLQ
jgi:hypothetical protein